VEAAAARGAAVKRGIQLEGITVGWMAAEAVLAVGAGIFARSVLLTAFGFDSFIELLSGLVVLRRLTVEARGAPTERIERLEATTTRISAALLVLLCIYVVASSVAGLAAGLRPEASILGIYVAASALIVMPLLAAAKSRANRIIDSPSLRADIAESITCAYMAGATLVGVGLSLIPGRWWIQYVAAFALLIWLVPETREAFDSARGEQHHR
jgi:divalent metal cation (Fe/Co/Zn/Cd) transporter